MTRSDFKQWLYRGQRPNWIARILTRITPIGQIITFIVSTIAANILGLAVSFLLLYRR